MSKGKWTQVGMKLWSFDEGIKALGTVTDQRPFLDTYWAVARGERGKSFIKLEDAKQWVENYPIREAEARSRSLV